MSQNADHVLDHFELFRGPEYKEMLANKKKNFENPVRGRGAGAGAGMDQDAKSIATRTSRAKR